MSAPTPHPPSVLVLGTVTGVLGKPFLGRRPWQRGALRDLFPFLGLSLSDRPTGMEMILS